MLILIKLIGILIVVLGIIFFLSPQSMRKYLAFWAQGKRAYIIGILRLVIGVVFLLAASQCRLMGVIVALGILCLIGSILIFVLGLDKVKSVLNWWGSRPLPILRVLSLIAVALGVLIIYSA